MNMATAPIIPMFKSLDGTFWGGAAELNANALAVVLCDSYYSREHVAIRLWEADDLRLWLEVYDLIGMTKLDPQTVIDNAVISSPSPQNSYRILACLALAERIYYTEQARARKWADYA